MRDHRAQRRDELAPFPELQAQYEALLAARGLSSDQPDWRSRSTKRKLRQYAAQMASDGAWPTAEPSRAGTLIPYDEAALGLAGAIDARRREIDVIVASMASQQRLRVHVGEYPHGSLNAQSLPVTGGVLLLINTGLMMLVHQSAKVLALGAPSWPLERLPPSRVHRDQQVMWLADIVRAYLGRGDSRYARQLPAMGGPRGYLAASLTNAAEQFAIAHEYGHVLAGHLDHAADPRSLLDLRQLRLQQPTFVQKSHAQELEADGHAVAIGINGRNFAGNVRDQRTRELAAYSGACLLLALDGVVQETRTVGHLANEPPEVSTHPDHRVRLDNLRSFAEQHVPQTVGWGDEVYRQAMSLARDVAGLLSSTESAR